MVEIIKLCKLSSYFVAGGRYKIYREERKGFVDTSLIIEDVSIKDHMSRWITPAILPHYSCFQHLPGTNVGAVTRWDLLRKVSLYKFMVSFYFAKVTLYFNNVELGSLLGAKVQKLSSVKILRLIIQYFFKLINHWTVQCRWCWLGIRPDKSWGGYQDKTGNSIFQQPGVPTPTYAGNIWDWSQEHQQGEGGKPVFRLGE